jgi:hypothetical protein
VTELRAGLIVGAVIAAGIVPACWLLASDLARVRKPYPIAGIAVVVGTTVAIAAEQHIPAAVLVAMVGVGVVCAIPRARASALVVAVAAFPFALVLATTLDDVSHWVRVLCVIVACAGAVAVARTDEEWRSMAPTPWLLAITALAVYLAVPDTEQTAPLLGVALPIALLARPFRLATLGRAGSGSVTVLVVWAAATGGRASDASVVGALACLALLVGLSVGHARSVSSVPVPRIPGLPAASAPSGVAVVLVHGVLALIASRVGAAHATLTRAAVVAIVVVAASIFAGTLLSPPKDTGEAAR